jgi:hypothetical protein
MTAGGEECICGAAAGLVDGGYLIWACTSFTRGMYRSIFDLNLTIMHVLDDWRGLFEYMYMYMYLELRVDFAAVTLLCLVETCMKWKVLRSMVACVEWVLPWP